jgi:hypothetical protein
MVNIDKVYPLPTGPALTVLCAKCIVETNYYLTSQLDLWTGPERTCQRMNYCTFRAKMSRR